MSNPFPFPPVTTNFRDLNDTLSPTYLLGPNGMRYRFSMSVMWDAVADGIAYAVLAGVPSRAPEDAFVFLAADRQVFQGFAESEPSYIGRLQQWLDTWGFAGLPTGILLAVLGWVLPVQPKILTVDNNGQWWTYAANTTPLGPPPASMPTPPTQTVAAGNWRWDSVSWPPAYAELWARIWVVMFSPSSSPFAAPSATSGGGNVSGDGTCCGWAGTNAQAAGLTKNARLQHSADVVIPAVIVSYDSTMFDSTQTFGSSKLPDGSWRYWAKVAANGSGTGELHQYVSARPSSTTCSFLDGTAPGFG